MSQHIQIYILADHNVSRIIVQNYDWPICYLSIILILNQYIMGFVLCVYTYDVSLSFSHISFLELTLSGSFFLVFLHIWKDHFKKSVVLPMEKSQ